MNRGFHRPSYPKSGCRPRGCSFLPKSGCRRKARSAAWRKGCWSGKAKCYRDLASAKVPGCIRVRVARALPRGSEQPGRGRSWAGAQSPAKEPYRERAGSRAEQAGSRVAKAGCPRGRCCRGGCLRGCNPADGCRHREGGAPRGHGGPGLREPCPKRERCWRCSAAEGGLWHQGPRAGPG